MGSGRPRLYLLNQFALVERCDGCWIWPFSKNGKGRAMFGGRSACRLLYEEIIGPLEPDIGVLHRCDNPACVNPDHWFPGDQLANMRDAIKKERFVHPFPQLPGERHIMAKLTLDQAAAIKTEIVEGRMHNRGRMPHGAMTAIAARYGLNKRHLWRLANGQRWGKVL